MDNITGTARNALNILAGEIEKTAKDLPRENISTFFELVKFRTQVLANMDILSKGSGFLVPLNVDKVNGLSHGSKQRISSINHLIEIINEANGCAAEIAR